MNIRSGVIVFLFAAILLLAISWHSSVFSTSQQGSEEYCLVVATGTFKVKIAVDYGDKGLLEDKTLRTDEGKALKFNSVVDALNYMSTQGWEFVAAYPVSSGVGGSVYHYLMKRRLT